MNKTPIELEYITTKHGPMLYPKHDEIVGGSFRNYGEYSSVETELLQSLLEPGDTVIDIGANLGALTIPFANAVGREGRVIAFEPQPFIANLLSANVAMNCPHNTTVVNAAVGLARETAQLPLLNYNQDANYGAADFREIAAIKQQGAFYQDVPVVVLEDVLDELPFEVNPAALIKVDVEGMELDVLKGAAPYIKTFRPLLYVEADRTSKYKPLVEFITELGYVGYWVITMLYTHDNYFNYQKELWPGQASFNLLCLPQGEECPVPGLPIAVAEQAGVPNELVSKYGFPVILRKHQ